MAQNEISDYNETDASNVDITGIDVQENVMRPPAVNNAFRALQGALKRWFKASLFRLRDGTDQTKLLAFDLSGITTATTRTITVPNANLDMTGWATGQIKFPATQVPSADANTLDDYEEGTWTPTITQGVVPTTSAKVGTYTKVGRLVTLTVTATFSSAGTGGSVIEVSNLPFAPSAGVNTCLGAGVFFDAGTQFYSLSVQTQSATALNFISTGGANNFGASPAVTIANTDRLSFTIQYEV